MLFGLILRGVAFEFRFKSEGWHRRFWDYTIHFGSLGAAFSRKASMLGAFIKGVADRQAAQFFWRSSRLDQSGFSIMTGIAVVVWV